MTEYVADAHAIAWYLFAGQRLGKLALEVFDEAEAGNAKIFIPAVALAEVIMVIEKNRLPGASMQQLEIDFALIQQSANFELLPLLPENVMASRTLKVIPDIFDPLIVSEALRLGLPLITRDSVIRASGVIKAVWD